jgi:hypothetical protein
MVLPIIAFSVCFLHQPLQLSWYHCLAIHDTVAWNTPCVQLQPPSCLALLCDSTVRMAYTAHKAMQAACCTCTTCPCLDCCLRTHQPFSCVPSAAPKIFFSAGLPRGLGGASPEGDLIDLAVLRVCAPEPILFCTSGMSATIVEECKSANPPVTHPRKQALQDQLSIACDSAAKRRTPCYTLTREAIWDNCGEPNCEGEPT